ncbi:TPA: hypothetical protein N0F65_003051 [Lagenidium giganteum]|uniref:Protein kinase domain-containing protein n=1 Tax=Lagenidium giganteum TaxID=4803 RepID=A0AAV2YGU0_9STRA|nr:TPA: hypothetical protein N0F65_003051 [Lagenidium giganteum]
MTSGRYCRIINRGVFADVFEMDTLDGSSLDTTSALRRRVAVKSVNLQLLRKAQGVLKSTGREADDPWREFHIATALTKVEDDHDAQYVVRYEHADLADDGNTLWLVMEYCTGGDLLGIMASRGQPHLEESYALQLFGQIARGVRFLHQRGIAHRDVSLENVVVHEGVCKLTDFGLATDNTGQCANRAGKDYYMAPEIVAGQTPYDGKRADLWSLGILLFVMLTGSPPFTKAAKGEKAFDAFCALGLEKFLEHWSVRSRLSRSATDVLMKLLMVDPRKRPVINDVVMDLDAAPELREIAEVNIPVAWQRKYKEIGQNYETLDELVGYFRQLVESNVSNRQPPHQRKALKEEPRNGSGQPKGNTPNGPPSKKKKKPAPPVVQTPQVAYPRHGECRAKNKSEESNFIDLEVTETCYLNINQPTPKPLTTLTTELLVALPMPSGKQRMWHTKGGKFTTIDTVRIAFKSPDLTTNRLLEFDFYVPPPSHPSSGYSVILGRDLLLALQMKFNFGGAYANKVSPTVHQTESRLVDILAAKYEKVDVACQNTSTLTINKRSCNYSSTTRISAKEREQTSKICSFILLWGKFRYTRLPKGNCTAPDEFQRRMQMFLGDLGYLRVYLDGVLVVTCTTFEDPSATCPRCLIASDPVASSRKLTGAQRKYTIMELELLSIVEVLREYRNILLGHRITVHADHKNLSLLTSSPTGYIKSSNNVAADALSRLPSFEDSISNAETCGFRRRVSTVNRGSAS